MQASVRILLKQNAEPQSKQSLQANRGERFNDKCHCEIDFFFFFLKNTAGGHTCSTKAGFSFRHCKVDSSSDRLIQFYRITERICYLNIKFFFLKQMVLKHFYWFRPPATFIISSACSQHVAKEVPIVAFRSNVFYSYCSCFKTLRTS